MKEFRVTITRTIVQPETGDGQRVMVPAGTPGVAVGEKGGMILVLVPADVPLYTLSKQWGGRAVPLVFDPDDLTFDSVGG